MNIALKNPVS